jgi:hypothetical protein
MKSIPQMTSPELAAYVQTHLRSLGIHVVLSGGGSVVLYSNGRYVSKDLDMVNIFATRHRKIQDAMGKIGFTEHDRYFTHSETVFFIDFVSGPLAIGDEPIRIIDEIELSTGVLRVISPTDCIKDRLAAFYHWKDLQTLEQAVFVAQTKDIDLADIERWSMDEGKLEEFNKIKKQLVGE